jgi:hypothetical protein
MTITRYSVLKIVSRGIAFSRKSIMASSNSRLISLTAQRVRFFMSAGSFLVLIHVSVT